MGVIGGNYCTFGTWGEGLVQGRDTEMQVIREGTYNLIFDNHGEFQVSPGTGYNHLYLLGTGYNGNIRLPIFNCGALLYNNRHRSVTLCEGADNFSRPFVSPQARTFNGHVEIPEGVTSCELLFDECTEFNHPVNIPNSVNTCVEMFEDCVLFNYPVDIPNSVVNCSAMFLGCYNFNHPVTIPDGVTDCSLMFSRCSNFNQPVTIPEGVTACVSMFSGCSNFNQPVTIPYSVTSCSSMFRFCYNLDQLVYIPEGVIDCSWMFANCTSFNKSVILPESARYANSMFAGDNMMIEYQIPIYVHRNRPSSLTVNWSPDLNVILYGGSD